MQSCYTTSQNTNKTKKNQKLLVLGCVCVCGSAAQVPDTGNCEIFSYLDVEAMAVKAEASLISDLCDF